MKRLLLLLVYLLLFSGCFAGATGEEGMKSSDPTERGCSYIAAAIVSSAIIRAIFNK